MFVANQFGCKRKIYLETIYIEFYDYKFSIIGDTDYGTCTLGEYDTPAQVERVIGMLKAAVARGDKDFIFPTADEMNGTHEKEACRKTG